MERVKAMRSLAGWWYDDASNPDRVLIDNPAVHALIDEIDPGSPVADLGGTMSLNVHLERAGLVLRVHQPFLSRHRLVALQGVRLALAREGLIVPMPVQRRGSPIFRCGDRWAELETFIPHERPAAILESYSWMFRALGPLHTALSSLDLSVPRPLVATYAPPSSLRRWLRVTQAVVRRDSEALDTVRWTGDLLKRLQRQWTPSTQLPRRLVHGDVRLGNVARSSEGENVYLDFGFLAMRPRVHDLAYSIAFMVIALNGHRDPDHFPWQCVSHVIQEYETASASSLSREERSACAGYTAAVPLYFTALAGLSNDPVGQLSRHGPWLTVSEWILSHPGVTLD